MRSIQRKGPRSREALRRCWDLVRQCHELPDRGDAEAVQPPAVPALGNLDAALAKAHCGMSVPTSLAIGSSVPTIEEVVAAGLVVGRQDPNRLGDLGDHPWGPDEINLLCAFQTH